MNKWLTWALVGFTGFRLLKKVMDKAQGIENWEYEIKGVGLYQLTLKKIRGYVDWEFINTSELQGAVKDIEASFFYKGSKIGSLSMPGPYMVPSKGTAAVRTNFDIDLEEVYSKAVLMLSELSQYGDVDLQIRGSVRVRAGAGFWVNLPVSTTTSAKTLYTYFFE